MRFFSLCFLSCVLVVTCVTVYCHIKILCFDRKFPFVIFGLNVCPMITSFFTCQHLHIFQVDIFLNRHEIMTQNISFFFQFVEFLSIWIWIFFKKMNLSTVKWYFPHYTKPLKIEIIFTEFITHWKYPSCFRKCTIEVPRSWKAKGKPFRASTIDAL